MSFGVDIHNEENHTREEIIAALEYKIDQATEDTRKRDLEAKLERELSGRKYPTQSIILPTQEAFNYYVFHEPDTLDQRLIYEELGIATIFEIIRSTGKGMKPSDIQKNVWKSSRDEELSAMLTIEEIVDILTGKVGSKLMSGRDGLYKLNVLKEFGKISGWYDVESQKLYEEACRTITTEDVKKLRPEATRKRLDSFLETRRSKFVIDELKKKRLPVLLSKRKIAERLGSDSRDRTYPYETQDHMFPKITDRYFWNPIWSTKEAKPELRGARLKTLKDKTHDNKPYLPIDAEPAFNFLLNAAENYCPILMRRPREQELHHDIQVLEGVLLTSLTPGGGFQISYKDNSGRLKNIDQDYGTELVNDYGNGVVSKRQHTAEEYQNMVRGITRVR